MAFEEFEWTNNTIASVVSGLTFRARIAAQTVRAKLEKRMTSNSSFQFARAGLLSVTWGEDLCRAKLMTQTITEKTAFHRS